MPISVSEPLVKVRALAKAFGTNQVLNGVDLDVPKGSVVSIIGASGSGKTTLLRCVNLLESYDSGSIQVDGVEVGYREGRKRRNEHELARIRADIGMVFQHFNLFPHLTATENVMLGLRKVRRMGKSEALRNAPSTGWCGWGLATSWGACRSSCLAGSSSALGLRGRWR